MRRRWILFLLALVTLGGLFFFLRVGDLSNPSVDYDLMDPAIVSVAQGTVGSVGSTRVGLKFVDASSAGVSLFYNEGSERQATDVILELGQMRVINGEEITLVDALPGRDTAIIRIISPSE